MIKHSDLSTTWLSHSSSLRTMLTLVHCGGTGWLLEALLIDSSFKQSTPNHTLPTNHTASSLSIYLYSIYFYFYVSFYLSMYVAIYSIYIIYSFYLNIYISYFSFCLSIQSRTDGQTDRQTDGQKDRQTDRRIQTNIKTNITVCLNHIRRWFYLLSGIRKKILWTIFIFF